MTMNPLPPQAYTKETLGKAFAWLQTQPEKIKEFATSPDILVSLYLKAKLNGDGVLERPSIQNFKSELKSLAGMIGEFEVMEPTSASEAMVGAAATRAQMDHQRPPTGNSSGSAPQLNAASALDSRSRSMIQEIQITFNLSTEAEALRLLIATGHRSLQKL